MNSRSLLVFLGLSALAPLASRVVAKETSDLEPPEKRRAIVEVAQRITRPPEAEPLPADLAQPFSPPGFDQPDPEELRAIAAANAKAAAAGAAAGARPGAAAGQAAGPSGDREILDSLAARLVPSGTIMLNGAPLLIIGKNRFEIGAHFTVTYNNQDYELELSSIDRTTFTLRYQSEEITRPIKPGKSQ